VAVGSGFALQWAQPPSLAQPIWGAVRAAGSLLVDGPIHRVRECCGDTCGWLFLDVSKNGSRLWCDMAVCGNRHKVARYRRRKARIAAP
jgi:predicted RNA-binding Zn ribbon-like protein